MQAFSPSDVNPHTDKKKTQQICEKLSFAEWF